VGDVSYEELFGHPNLSFEHPGKGGFADLLSVEKVQDTIPLVKEPLEIVVSVVVHDGQVLKGVREPEIGVAIELAGNHP
jgi:hypothetical protein